MARSKSLRTVMLKSKPRGLCCSPPPPVAHARIGASLATTLSTSVGGAIMCDFFRISELDRGMAAEVEDDEEEEEATGSVDSERNSDLLDFFFFLLA